MPSAKTTIILAVIGLLGAIIKLWLQHRQMIELREKEATALKERAADQAAATERAARHAREAAEREEERAQTAKLIAELQQSNTRTLDFMEAQLKSQQEAGARRYEIIERNTAVTEKLATACAAQSQELRVMVDRVGRLEGGAGCRAAASPAGRA